MGWSTYSGLELMGWAGASPLVPTPVAGEGASHRQEVSVTSFSQKEEHSGFQAKKNRNKIILHTPREHFCRRVRG